jgi:hypothetical protein
MLEEHWTQAARPCAFSGLFWSAFETAHWISGHGRPSMGYEGAVRPWLGIIAVTVSVGQTRRSRATDQSGQAHNKASGVVENR